MNKAFVLLIFTLMFATGAISAEGQIAKAGPSKFKGVEYAFDPKAVPDHDPQTVFVVFYGMGKPGYDTATGRPYPPEKRRIFSRIYRLNDLPYGYNWNSLSLAPAQMAPLFFDHLVKNYDFDRNNHEVKMIYGRHLSTLESQLAEMISGMKPGDEVIADKTFSFKYADRNYVRPYSFEYKSPIE